MKLTQVALIIVAATSSVAGFAAELTTSSNVTLLALDGQKVSSGLLKKDKAISISDDAVHQAVVKVEEIVKAGSDRRLYESAPIVVKFKTARDNVVIKANSLSTIDAASRFDSSPKVDMFNASGESVETKQAVLPQEGLFPNARIVETLNEYNMSNQKASVSGFATASIPVMAGMNGVGKAQKGKVVVQGENIAEQQLQYWFQQADKETQQRFLKWAQKK